MNNFQAAFDYASTKASLANDLLLKGVNPKLVALFAILAIVVFFIFSGTTKKQKPRSAHQEKHQFSDARNVFYSGNTNSGR